MDGCRAFGSFVNWVRADANFSPALDSVSVAFHGGPDFSRLSMGCASFGDRLSYDFFGAVGIESAFSTENGVLADYTLASMVVVIPADVLVGDGQIEQRRSRVAKFHGVVRALRDATASNAAGLASSSIADSLP